MIKISQTTAMQLLINPRSLQGLSLVLIAGDWLLMTSEQFDRFLRWN